MRYHIVAIFSLICSSLAVNPGLRTAITSKGLDYIRQVTIPILEKSLSTLNIPDISGSASTPIGSIDYYLTDIKFTALTIPTSSFTTGSQGLEVKASGISMHITANWKYREHSWPHLEDSGSCDISVSSVSLSVSVRVGVDSKGHATLSSTGCSIDIGNLDITFHGGASWLYNLFSDYIADKLKGSIQDQVCKETINEINTEGNAALESLPVIVKVDDVSEVSFALLQAPIFTTTYVETNHKGEFLSISHPVEAPFTPAPLPAVSDVSKMMYVWLTDYIANSAGSVYQMAGILHYNVTPNMVPSGFPFKLNTASFKALIPQLYEKYPNMDMMLELNASATPMLKITPGGANFTVPGHVKVDVLEPNKTTKEAFVIGVDMLADVYLWVHMNGTKEVISGNLTFLRADLSLISTNIGPFNVGVLQAAANLLCKALIIPLFNRYGNVGLIIPVVDGISFVNSTITLGQGYVVVSTDFNYKPTFLEKPKH